MTKKEKKLILRKDINDVEMQMGRRVALVVVHKPCRKNGNKLI